MPAWLKRWLTRHQHPVSRLTHAVGIPMLVVAGGLALWQLVEWRWDLWYRPVLVLGASYGLQWLGHRVEGNDMGEVILVKRWLGLPYVAESPRYARREADASDSPVRSHG